MRRYFRPLFFIGLGLLFLSLFFEWYVFQIFNADRRLIVYWSYNPLFGWKSVFSSDAALNNAFKPPELAYSFILNILFMISLGGTLVSALLKDIESTDKGVETLFPYMITFILLLCLNLCYIIVIPVMLWLPNELYFPFLIITDKDADLTYSYSIGPGYILQTLGFLLVFPYALFYILTIFRFQTPAYTIEDQINKYIEKVIEKPDLDELIAKEEVKLKTTPSNELDLEPVQVIPISNQKMRRR